MGYVGWSLEFRETPQEELAQKIVKGTLKCNWEGVYIRGGCGGVASTVIKGNEAGGKIVVSV